jgi:membrane-associated phospholipid phosphatase
MTVQQTSSVLPTIASTRINKVARLVSKVSNPSILAVIECLLVGLLLGTISGWLWSLFVVVITTLAPVIYIASLSRKGHITDFDVFLRQQRNRPYIFTGICSALALVTILIFQAPWILIFLCLWKISAHTASSASFSVVVWQLFGPFGLLAFLIVPLIAWSRVKLHRHSIGQVIFGAVTGTAIYYIAFTFFYTHP